MTDKFFEESDAQPDQPGAGMPAVLSMGQVCAELGNIPLSTVEALRENGMGGRFFKIGRRLFIRRADFDLWVEALADKFPAQDAYLGAESAPV